MARQRLRAIQFLPEPPEYELLDGTVLETRYLDAAGAQVLEVYESDRANPDKLYALLSYVSPGLTRETFERLGVHDVVALIAISKGAADQISEALKNVASGGANGTLTPPLPQPSTSTTPSPASSPT